MSLWACSQCRRLQAFSAAMRCDDCGSPMEFATTVADVPQIPHDPEKAALVATVRTLRDELAQVKTENERLAAEHHKTHDWNSLLVKEHYALRELIRTLKSDQAALTGSRDTLRQALRNLVAECKVWREEDLAALDCWTNARCFTRKVTEAEELLALEDK